MQKKSTNFENTAENLVLMRDELNFTQKEMANLLNVSKQFYSACELGTKELAQARFDILFRHYEKSQRTNKINHDLQITGMIDFLRIRFQTLNYVEIVERILKLNPKNFTIEPRGGYSYKNKMSYGGIKVYYSNDIKMGCMIDLSGSACRELEYAFETQNRDWQQFFDDVFDYIDEQTERYNLTDNFWNITRLDLALDELFRKLGNFNLRTLLTKVYENDLVSKLKRFVPNEAYELFKGLYVSQGLSLEFGNRKGEVYFVFYEKDLEQVQKTKRGLDEIHETDQFKNRYEVRLADEKAKQAIEKIFREGESLVDYAVKIINSYITVYDDRGNNELCQEWYELLGDISKQKFITKPREFTLAKKLRWAEKTISPSNVAIKLISKIKKTDYLNQFEEQAKVSERDIKLIESEFELAKTRNTLNKNERREIELEIEFLKERLEHVKT
ncbi:replication initiation factor domain-containing protein [Pseudolactococcus yaeyamensis]